MEKDQKLVKAITPMDKNFAQWYTDIILKAELCDYSSVRGCMIIRPYGYAIWENIQKHLNDAFKATGHENVYMPGNSWRGRKVDRANVCTTDFRNAILRALG